MPQQQDQRGRPYNPWNPFGIPIPGAPPRTPWTAPWLDLGDKLFSPQAPAPQAQPVPKLMPEVAPGVPNAPMGAAPAPPPVVPQAPPQAAIPKLQPTPIVSEPSPAPTPVEMGSYWDELEAKKQAQVDRLSQLLAQGPNTWQKVGQYLGAIGSAGGIENWGSATSDVAAQQRDAELRRAMSVADLESGLYELAFKKGESGDELKRFNIGRSDTWAANEAVRKREDLYTNTERSDRAAATNAEMTFNQSERAKDRAIQLQSLKRQEDLLKQQALALASSLGGKTGYRGTLGLLSPGGPELGPAFEQDAVVQFVNQALFDKKGKLSPKLEKKFQKAYGIPPPPKGLVGDARLLQYYAEAYSNERARQMTEQFYPGAGVGLKSGKLSLDGTP